MSEEVDKPVPTFKSILAKHLSISCGVVAAMTPVSIFLLYTWANSLGTCVKRPPFTLLSILEKAVPVIMRPIQSLVCPH